MLALNSSVGCVLCGAETPANALSFPDPAVIPQTAANARCALEEGFLAEFDTQNELDLLYAVCIGKRCWIGGNDVAQEG